MRNGKPIIGLCGAIGSGKSAAAKALEDLGCLVIDSDRINHDILNRPETLATLRDWWGEGMIAADGRADRKRIAEIIFRDPAEKRRLESLTYPLIDLEREHIISAGVRDPAVKAIILDSPLLFESRLDRLCDAIVFIEIDESTRLARLQQIRGWDVAETRRRERWQLPIAEKRARSHHVIPNNGSPGELRERVGIVLEVIRESFSRMN